MANADRPRGFAPLKPTPVTLVKPKSGVTFAIGDPLVYEVGAGVKVATATDREIYAVAAEGCTSGTPTMGGSLVRVWLVEAGRRFVAQCSGTAAQATHELADCDIESTLATGDFELNENASVVKTCKILRLLGRPDNAWGANADVICIFNFPQGDIQAEDVDSTDLGYDGSGNLAVKTHRCWFHGQVGGAGTITLKGPPCPVAGTVSKVVGTSDTATSSDGSNLWAIDLQDSAENSLFSAAWDTNADGDFVADTPLDMSAKLASSPTVVQGELLIFVMTETGTATDLSGAHLGVLVEIEAF